MKLSEKHGSHFRERQNYFETIIEKPWENFGIIFEKFVRLGKRRKLFGDKKILKDF